MTHNDYYYLGLITKPFGYKGQVYIYLDTDEPEKYANLRAVFMEECEASTNTWALTSVSFRL